MTRNVCTSMMRNVTLEPSLLRDIRRKQELWSFLGCGVLGNYFHQTFQNLLSFILQLLNPRRKEVLRGHLCHVEESLIAQGFQKVPFDQECIGFFSYYSIVLSRRVLVPSVGTTNTVMIRITRTYPFSPFMEVHDCSASQLVQQQRTNTKTKTNPFNLLDQ